QGYDLVMYLGQSLYRNGVQLVPPERSAPSPFGHILLRPVYAADARPDGDFPILYYENQGIRVLEFIDQAYQVVH
ncbi:MAG: hypothetical protein R3330_00135, partial [Saprospiraceae bacterium]|nr:hypothetical protein [Saprospiraceae bacterium]